MTPLVIGLLVLGAGVLALVLSGYMYGWPEFIDWLKRWNKK